MTVEKYLMYEITTRKAGLRHQAYNLRTLVHEAFELGRVPVISKWYLFGYHNFNNELKTNFSRYFNFQKVSVGNQEVKVVFEDEVTSLERRNFGMSDPVDPNARLAVRQFPPSEGCSWKYHKTSFDIYHDVKIPFSKQVIASGQRLLNEVGSPLTVVHVRRRDVLKKKWRLWFDTRPNNIIRVLKTIDSPHNVYIMSNEPKVSFFDKVGAHYRLTTIRDVPWLMEVQREDNFLAFCIENQLLKMVDKRVTTFGNNTDEAWHGYLSKTKW